MRRVLSHFLCVPLAATVEVAGTVAMNTAGSTWESSLKLETSQRVLLSVPQWLCQSQLPVQKCTRSFTETHIITRLVLFLLFCEGMELGFNHALFYSHTEQEVLTNGSRVVFREQGVLNLLNSVLYNKKTTKASTATLLAVAQR